LSKAHHLPQQRLAFARAAREFWDAYQCALGTVDWRDELELRATRHTLACLLARVAGRSPLEYLGTNERMRQQDVVVELMAHPPLTLAALVEQFTTWL